MILWDWNLREMAPDPGTRHTQPGRWAQGPSTATQVCENGGAKGSAPVRPEKYDTAAGGQRYEGCFPQQGWGPL
jgi:hypothetical protein